MRMTKVLSLIIALAMILGTMGTVVFAEEQTSVAKIGETEYATFGEAMTAAKSENGAVEVELYDKVTLNQSLDGSYGTIKFIGKDTDAEIYLDVQGYITASGKTVAFENLKLSKSSGSFITNAGFMNVAFGVYDVNSVSYKDCVFSNGAYASSGKTTFTNCTFYKSHDKYGLWAYGNVDCTVDGCTFADYRGIKMYAEGAAKTVDLTVKNTNFPAVDNKPAIVLTYGESVTLENNTYSSTGVFELDLDGAPNGTSVTSDVAPTCKNDNGACGVLVDGKIYTTVTDAVAVAESGDTVTLLYDTEEDVTFAEGVIFDSNGNTAPNVKIEGNTSTLPEAKLEKLAPMVLTSADSYMTWPSGDSSIDRPLNVVVKFSAIDTEETVENSPYKGWYTDYYITFDGLKNDSFVADGCYLAGNYGSYGWIVIPVDGLEIEEGVVYPVVSSYDAHLTYKEICTNVKEMICAIYIKPEIIEANPDMNVTLNLGIKNGDAGEVVYVNSSVYDADELAGYVAKVGDEKYTSFADAVAAADGKTVTLLTDVALEETITVAAGKTVTLDLNGKTITGTDNASSGNFRLIANKGTLTVDDNVGTGAITLAATNNRGYTALSAVISNEGGTLTVKKGKIEHLGGSDMAYGIDNNSTLGETKVVVEGGTIISPYRGIRAFQNSKTKMNSIVMKGGKIVARAGIWMHQSGADSLGEVTVIGGKIEAVANAIVTDIHSGAKTTITIKGGEFSNTSTTANLLLVWPFSDMSTVTEANKTLLTIEGGSFDCAGEGKLIGILNGADTNTDVAVSGGTFSEAIGEEYIADGFKLVSNNDGTYGITSYWVTATDAGYYLVDGNKKGLMRYLFHFSIEGEIEEAYIKYIKGSDLSSQQAGEIERGELTNTFYGDIIDVPETATDKYYAVGYVKIDGKDYWSNPIFCEPDFTRHFSSLDIPDNGGNE